MKSIKALLLFYVFITLIILNICYITWSYYKNKSFIESIYNTQLIRKASDLNSVFSVIKTSHSSLTAIQKNLKQSVENITKKNIKSKNEGKKITEVINKYSKNTNLRSVFQIRNKKNKLLLHSRGNPTKAPLAPIYKTGFSTNQINNQTWFVYTLINTKQHIIIQTAHLEESRKELVTSMIKSRILPIFITMFSLLIIIMLLINHFINKVIIISNKISLRNPKNLTHIPEKNIPKEILPLVHALNNLFNVLQDTYDREKKFNADAAHELRTPIAALKLQTQIAIREKNPEKQAHALNQIIMGADRCSHVIDQLLELSKISSTQTLNNVTPVNLKEVIAELIPEAELLANQKNIELDLDLEKKISNIEANKTSLSILFRNLIDNAIRYTPNDPNNTHKIWIKVFEKDNKVIFELTDSGPGIPIELRERVFDRFYRTLGTNESGTGLGLSIVQKILELHKANIKLDDSQYSKTGLKIEIEF